MLFAFEGLRNDFLKGFVWRKTRKSRNKIEIKQNILHIQVFHVSLSSRVLAMKVDIKKFVLKDHF